MTTNTQKRTGDCEGCMDSINVPLTFTTLGNMWLCGDCKAKEDVAVASSKIIADSKKNDAVIEVKADLFLNATVPFIALKAAIDNDPTIPEDQKDVALVKASSERIHKMNAVIVEEDAKQVARKNERYAWVINTQEFVSKMKADRREKCKQYDLSYKPEVKESKPKKVQTPVKVKRTELAEAAAKYGVPANGVHMTMISRNLKAEDAARFLAGQMGLLK